MYNTGRKRVFRNMKLIERNDYLQQMLDASGTTDIKVITGVRRSGKSKLLTSFIQKIKETDGNANIIHINFNETDFENLLEYHALESYVNDHYVSGVNNYLCIDEIQMCHGFEKAINSLQAKELFDIYITGSNAFLQSSDLATLFVGRTFEISLYPFSFEEFMKYYAFQNPYEGLNDYILHGGMAGSYVYKNDRQRTDYLNNQVLNALIVRDIINKRKIRNVPLMNRLIDYLMDNIGNITSITNITNAIRDSSEKTDHKTIDKYIGYLCNSFLFYKVDRYDIKGKKYLKTDAKYYLCDHSFRYARLGTRNMDYGRTLENTVAIELMRRGYEVYVGKLYKKEIDFVAVHQGEKIYIQVSNSIADPDTFKREITPLLQIRDAYPKMIITRIYQPAYQYEGVQIIDAADWLLNHQAVNH